MMETADKPSLAKNRHSIAILFEYSARNLVIAAEE